MGWSFMTFDVKWKGHKTNRMHCQLEAWLLIPSINQQDLIFYGVYKKVLTLLEVLLYGHFNTLSPPQDLLLGVYHLPRIFVTGFSLRCSLP